MIAIRNQKSRNAGTSCIKYTYGSNIFEDSFAGFQTAVLTTIKTAKSKWVLRILGWTIHIMSTCKKIEKKDHVKKLFRDGAVLLYPASSIQIPDTYIILQHSP